MDGPIACVGIVCLRGEDVLLIRRGRPPLAGAWSLPGGRIQRGETAAAAALRELAEETGAAGEIIGLIELFDGLFPEGHYLIAEFAARWTAGEPRADDDAAEARFFPLSGLGALDLTPDMARVIRAGADLLASC